MKLWVRIPPLACAVLLNMTVALHCLVLVQPRKIPLVVSYKLKYVHEVLVNHLVKLAQEKKVCLGELTIRT